MPFYWVPLDGPKTLRKTQNITTTSPVKQEFIKGEKGLLNVLEAQEYLSQSFSASTWRLSPRRWAVYVQCHHGPLIYAVLQQRFFIYHDKIQ